MGRLQTAPGLLHYAVNMQTIYMFMQVSRKPNELAVSGHDAN